jgi:hypothetical protein
MKSNPKPVQEPQIVHNVGDHVQGYFDDCVNTTHNEVFCGGNDVTKDLVTKL